MGIYTTLGLTVLGYMTAWYVIGLAKRRNDVADIAWGLGFPIVGWVAFLTSGFSKVSLMTNILVTIWGLRLARHIYLRNRKRGEDSRYLAWRKEWNNFYIRSYLQIYIFQGLLMLIISSPVVLINTARPDSLGLMGAAGVMVWMAGFGFEVVGDQQLANFISKEKNKGKIMQDGLWRYSRHPNYFGEVVLWWGIFLMAVGQTRGWTTIIGPATITYLILFVSGIPMLEKKYAGREDFEEYKRKTSAFVPIPPKAKRH